MLLILASPTEISGHEPLQNPSTAKLLLLDCFARHLQGTLLQRLCSIANPALCLHCTGHLYMYNNNVGSLEACVPKGSSVLHTLFCLLFFLQLHKQKSHVYLYHCSKALISRLMTWHSQTQSQGIVCEQE